MKLRWLGIVLGLAACSAETAGQEVPMRWVFAQPDAASSEFDTATGWHVTLSEARIALESIYAYGADPEASLARRLSQLIVPVAHAHGGHDPATGRPVRAELLDPPAIDLLDPEPHRLPLQDAEAGPIETLKILIAKPGAALPSALHGAQLYVSGSAEREGARVDFQGGVHFEDSEPARRIERTGLHVELKPSTTIRIGVRASVWLEEAEFDRIAGDGSRGPVEITADSQVGRALAIGARSPDAFVIEFGRE
jgi:hypothetical protein